jgi:hypothetical protein
MTASTDTLERLLAEDLEALAERLADERLCRELYGALSGSALHKRGEEGRLTLSWGRAEELINRARAAEALPPLEGLTQSGAEGEVTDRARDALDVAGWDLRPRETGRDDPSHVGRPESPPSQADAGQEPWERQAHEDADAELHRQRTGESRGEHR